VIFDTRPLALAKTAFSVINLRVHIYKLLIAALVKDYIQTLIAALTLGLVLLIATAITLYHLWLTIVTFVTGLF
jgi:hypothetical protein